MTTITALRSKIAERNERRRKRKEPQERKALRSVEAHYSKLILGDFRKLRGLVQDRVADNLHRWSTRLDSVRMDDDLTDGITSQIEVVKRIYDAIKNTRRNADLISKTVSSRQKEAFRREYRRVLGVDPLQAEPWLRQQLDLFTTDNINLIQKMEEDYLSRVQGEVISGFRRGETNKTIAERIRAATGVTENRARLIARDQVAKLNTGLEAKRAQANGVKEYIWHTNIDGRERSEHRRLDGTRQSWDEAPISNKNGEHNHPGQDIQCRCWAENIYSHLLDL